MGEDVGVDFGGHVMGGKIIALSAQDHWLVRFPTFGPAFDQEIGADKLRPAPPPQGAEAPSAAPKPVPAPPPPAAPAAEKKPEAPPPYVTGDAVIVQQRGVYLACDRGQPGREEVEDQYEGSGEDEVPTDRLARRPSARCSTR